MLMFVWRGNDWSGRTWSCHTWGVRRIRQLCVRPGIAKSRPGESGQGGGGVLPANLINIFLEFGALRLGNSTCSHVACLDAAADETFAADPPASTHEGSVVPFEAILKHFLVKLRLQFSLSFN